MHENFPVTCFSLQLSRLLCIGCFQRPFKIFLNWFLEILINWCTQECYIQPILSDASNQCSLCWASNCVCVRVHMCAPVWGGQKTAWGSLALGVSGSWRWTLQQWSVPFPVPSMWFLQMLLLMKVSETLCCYVLFAGLIPLPPYEGESAWLSLLFLQSQKAPLGALGAPLKLSDQRQIFL